MTRILEVTLALLLLASLLAVGCLAVDHHYASDCALDQQGTWTGTWPIDGHCQTELK